jgi:NAD(P)H-dependent FMN reductase
MLISGSLRKRSTNSAALRTAIHLAPQSVEATFYEGMADLPHFNPDDDHDPLPVAVARFRAEIRAADVLVFSTPEYAGALPGTFKNLLDWTVGDDQTGSINGKPVAWVNVSPRGAPNAHESLRKVLGYVAADIIERACVAIPVMSDMVGEDGLIADHSVGRQLAEVLVTMAGLNRPNVGYAGSQ